MLTITSFNGIPYQAEIDVIPTEGPYVLSTSQVVDDISGNDNGLADFTETVFLDVTLENIGIELATGVEAVLSTSDPNVTITSDTYGVGDVDLGAVIQIDNAFVFEVANDVDDQHVVTFILTLTDDQGNTWTTDFPVVLNAPFLECVYPHWIDDSTGNNNGQPDSGETVVVHTFILNSGHAATLDGISGTLSDNSPYTDLPTPTTAIGNLAPGETGEITFPMSVALDAPLGEQILLGFETVSGAYDQMCAYMDDLNLVMEDWETGDVSQYNWILEGDENWFVSTNDPFEGAYCMESGNIGNSEQTILKIVLQLPQADDVTFSYRVSSEQNYDFLRFRVNGLTIASWSGEVEWAQYTQTLQAGTQTLRWIYEKDNIVTGGEDAAWVDNIILPPGAFVSIAEEHVAPDTFVLYPNPATDAVTLAINLEQPSTMQLTAEDQLGRTIEVLRLPTAAAGERFYHIDTSSWSPGVYLLRVTTSHGSMVQRLVIH